MLLLGITFFSAQETRHAVLKNKDKDKKRKKKATGYQES